MAKVVSIANPTGTEFTNVNAGGVDVPPYSVVSGITLTDAEAGVIIDTLKALITKDTMSTEEIRLACKIRKLGKNPGTATS